MSIPAPVADWVTIPELYADPFPIYKRLRAEGGVHWVPAVNRYLITSYPAVHETEFDQATYSADERGSLQIRAMGHSMLRRDDPEHYIERRAWQPVLRPGVVKRTWTAVFQRNARRYLAELVERGPGADLIWDFAAPYAAENLREILGFENVDQRDLQRWSQALINATGNYADDPEVWAEGERSFHEVDDALDEMLRWHANHPGPSLISSLLRIPDYLMPLDSIRANIKMTIGGGLNEPRDALGVAAWALLTHPEERRAVDGDPTLWDAAFDETIRWVAPIGLYSRQTTRDTVLEGVELPAGARLGICILSANRDESVWGEAARFDVRREVKPHLAFSKGVHVCLGAWVARAEVAAVGLPLLFGALRGLATIPENPPEVGGWVFRGMLRLPVAWDAASLDAPVFAAAAASSTTRPATGFDRAPSVAIVGSGPAGCFTAQAVRRTFPTARVEVFERLPVPFGLVRYGVAADHQGTKSVARQFERLFTREGVRFHGDVEVGVALRLDQLRAAFDVVVLATGLHADSVLPVPGAQRRGVVGAGAVTRALNAHPGEDELLDLGEAVAVVGNGNVALDVVRMIVAPADRLEGSDVDDAARERIVGRVRVLHVVGRSPVPQAKFDPALVRELATIPGVQHVVHGLDRLQEPEGRDARVDAVRALAAVGRAVGGPRVEWWFESVPEAVTGGESVTGLDIRGPDGEAIHLTVRAVVTAIGFDPDDPVAVPEPGAHAADGRVERGLYVAGWLRRGPRGTIPDQRSDSRALARVIAADVASGLVVPGAPGAEALPALDEVDFDGWRRIDSVETARADPGRVRAKLRSLDELRAAARDERLELAAPPAVELDQVVSDELLLVTILYGTESGNAELIAEELRQQLAARAEILIVDLADADPDELDRTRIHLVICSTYGDGEMPTSVRPFAAALRDRRPELGGLTYAMFGLGDRSYTRTYSRGSELLDEALAECGAERIGVYGRHDAAGAMESGDAAREWAESVLDEVRARKGDLVS